MPATVSETETICAPAERVFAYRRDVTNLPRYNPNVAAVEALPGGDRYRFRVRLLPGLRVRAALEVTEVDPPRRLVFEIRSLLDAREVCTFEPEGDGTRIRFEAAVRSPRGLVGRLIDRWFVIPSARRQIREELALMKAHLERR